MANKVLSVVVPTYNMEAYLPRCLDSVTREDVPDTLEVIVVNDGSKDRSLEIAKEYQAKRPNIISIIDKPNGHYGSCINAALKVATGKYFRPLDADDWFDTDALTVLLQEMSICEDDMIITNYSCHRKSKIVNHNVRINSSIQKIKNNDNIALQQPLEIFSMHAITYKLNLLRGINLSLTEGINYTDTEYVFYPLHSVKNCLIVDVTLYHYDLTRDDQSVNPMVMVKNHSQQAQLLKRMLSCSHPFSKMEHRLLTFYLTNYYYQLIFCCQDDQELNEIDKLVKKKSPSLRTSVNRSLAFAPILWRILGIHIFWYEHLKKFFKLDR